jgi:hypothetical protein
MKAALKRIEVIANVSIIVTASLLCFVVVKNSLLRRSLQEPGAPKTAPAKTATDKVKPAIQTGMKISLPGVDFARNDRTLLLALSTTCHFCSESADFYKKLEKEHGNTRMIAVLPQPAAAGRDYLNKLGVSVDEVVQAQLSAIQVRGTPTLIMIDQDGAVIDYWVGKLANTEEPKVIDRLREGRGD